MWDAATATCTTEGWAEIPSSPWPALTAEEGTAIGFAIMLIWVLGFGFRQMKKTLDL